MDELYKSAKGVRITPPQNEYIYAGVGRALMLKECEKHGIPYEERPILLDELFTADEVFRVSGSSLCMRVMEIDGKPVGGKDEKNLTILQNSLLEKFLRETEKKENGDEKMGCFSIACNFAGSCVCNQYVCECDFYK